MRDEKSAADLDVPSDLWLGASRYRSSSRLLCRIWCCKSFTTCRPITERYPKIMAITRKMCSARGTKYIDMAHLQVIAVGDASTTRDIPAK